MRAISLTFAWSNDFAMGFGAQFDLEQRISDPNLFIHTVQYHFTQPDQNKHFLNMAYPIDLVSYHCKNVVTLCPK